jgi:hypothetical protein
VVRDRVSWKAKSSTGRLCVVVCSGGGEDGTTTGKVVGGDDATTTVVGGGGRGRLRSNTGRELVGACSDTNVRILGVDTDKWVVLTTTASRQRAWTEVGGRSRRGRRRKQIASGEREGRRRYVFVD